MKTKLKYFLLMVFVFIFGSCVDYLDRTPDATAFDEDEIFTDIVMYKNFAHQLLLKFHFFDDEDWTNNNSGAGSAAGTVGKYTYGLRERISDNLFPNEINAWVGAVQYRYGFGGSPYSDGSYWGEGYEIRYSGFWRGIRVANLCIANIDRLENATEADKNYILGLAYFCRAHFYFMLCQGWGGMPYLTEPLDPKGTMDFERLSYTETCQKIAEDFETAHQYLPNRVELMNFGYPTKIGAKALKAKALLWAASPFANPSNDKQLWNNAAVAAGEVLALAEGSGGYHALVPIDKWKKLFIDCDEYEVLRKESLYGRYFDQIEVGGRPHNWHIPSTDAAWGPGGDGVDVPQENLAMCYPWSNGEPVNPTSPEYRSEPFYGWGSSNGGHDGRDKRFYHMFIFNGAKHQLTSNRGRDVEIWHTSDLGETPRDIPGQNVVTGAFVNGTAVTGYYENKNFSPVSGGSGTRYFNRMEHYVRLAEMYLYYAEAANRVWGPTGAPQGTGVNHTALSALNMVRTRAELPAFSPSATEPWLRPGTWQEFEDVIRNEVRIETAMESKRFYDLRRWRLMQDPSVTVSLGLLIHQNADGTFTYTQRNMPANRTTDKWQERHYLFRIPLSDTRIGPKFKQNPGW